MPTSVINFTKPKLEALQPPTEGRAYYRDTQTKGLTMQVTAGGCRTFYFYGKIDRRPERIRLGEFPGLSIDAARKAAERIRGRVAAGENPAIEKRDARKDVTFGELFQAYLQKAKQTKRSWQEDENQYDRHLTDWKDRQLSAIRKSDVSALHSSIGQTAPYAANRVLALVSAIFNWARNDYGLKVENPCRGIGRFPEVKRDRFLQPAELKSFFAALDHPQTPELWRDFFKLAILTGARRGNLTAMRWDEIDLDRGLWRIEAAASKNKQAMGVILVPDAIAILKQRLETVGDRGAAPWVFPSFGKTGHVAETKSGWKDVITRAGLTGIRPHDLRRTFASWQSILGSSLTIVGKSLGHQSTAATQIYARLNQEAVRASVEQGTAKMLQLAGVPTHAKPKRKRKAS
ncbi:MAG: tyrosine-type recombinase/integrase [Phycisphaerales bacterium]|nr:tyrosine-type recombinase/integrase [Phycisphaerales bacterium]